MKKKISIAIDGYSSCGKSTLAKQLAKKLNYIFIDTGAMYRAVTLFALKNKMIGPQFFETKQLIKKLPEINIAFTRNEDNTGNLTWLNGELVEDQIRTMEVSSLVSQVSAIKEVRQKMVELQQNMAESGGVVMDGRDIGTVVMPKAELKIFMTASNQIRAKRRFDELSSKNLNITMGEIQKNLEKRDFIDSNREESPLRKAADAIVLDNSNLNQEEQLALVLGWVNQSLG